MTKEENTQFIQKTESLVKPEDITTISFLGDFNKYLPKKTQQKIMEKGSSTIPYMGFIVDPYCFFLAYEITDTEAAQEMLPKGYELADSTLFQEGNKKPLVIACAFTARTSAFIGMRLEFYIIARNIETGLLSWIISDYETNTNSHDPKNGFGGYTCDTAIFTTTPYGELLVDIKGRKDSREFSFSADLKNGKTMALDSDLWINGNFSVDYGGVLKDESSENFSLIFDPILMKEAISIPIDHMDIKKNSYMSNIINPENPLSAAVFPYGQHFIIKQDLPKFTLRTESDVVVQIKDFLKINEFKTMSGDALKKPLFRGMLISSLVNFSIILFLLIKLLT